ASLSNGWTKQAERRTFLCVPAKRPYFPAVVWPCDFPGDPGSVRLMERCKHQQCRRPTLATYLTGPISRLHHCSISNHSKGFKESPLSNEDKNLIL
ncbi:hypothetical protein COCON_G00229300, partial [Conger conger]